MKNNETTRPLWSVISAKYGSLELDKLLEDGYEPWQMYTDRAPGCCNLDVIIMLRKLTVLVPTDNSQSNIQTPWRAEKVNLHNERLCAETDCFEPIHDPTNPKAVYCIRHVCLAGGCVNRSTSQYGYCNEHSDRNAKDGEIPS